MKNELVVKDNILINASYNLELTEQRLILLAIVEARESQAKLTSDTVVQISAQEYAKTFYTTNEAAYAALKSAVNNLFERKFSYKEYRGDQNKEFIVKSRWVSKIAYADNLGVLEVTFASDVVPLIIRLEKHFTSYQLKQVSQLSSKYAIRLYEILISWREVGKTPVITIQDFRNKIGLENSEYLRMDNLKRIVIEPAIKQINKYTDIYVEYEQFKSGRSIVGLQFRFKLKDFKMLNSIIDKEPEKQIKLTEKQILLFANKLAYDDAFASKHAEVGEEYTDLEKRLIKKLSDNEFIKKYSKDLERVGLNFK
ncbi:replication initiation protein RepM [Acinetobacter sp. HY1485]|uniref:replication initiation protein RepM n=1 Tax=Acinetobacter sp. HY1485 TaxID=2970918 RepID=UPI0022B98144|nr:replication initiation protein RepM [Acinetobacter sp. HY1485]